jgi:hypothetical protein
MEIKEQSIRNQLQQVDFKNQVAIIEGFTEAVEDDRELRILIVIGCFKYDMFEWKCAAVSPKTNTVDGEIMRGKATTLDGVIEEINETLSGTFSDIDWKNKITIKDRKSREAMKKVTEQYSIDSSGAINVYGIQDALENGDWVIIGPDKKLVKNKDTKFVEYYENGILITEFDLSIDGLKDFFNDYNESDEPVEFVEMCNIVKYAKNVLKINENVIPCTPKILNKIVDYIFSVEGLEASYDLADAEAGVLGETVFIIDGVETVLRDCYESNGIIYVALENGDLYAIEGDEVRKGTWVLEALGPQFGDYKAFRRLNNYHPAENESKSCYNCTSHSYEGNDFICNYLGYSRFPDREVNCLYTCDKWKKVKL